MPNRLETVSTRFEQFWSLQQIFETLNFRIIFAKFHQMEMESLNLHYTPILIPSEDDFWWVQVISGPPATFLKITGASSRFLKHKFHQTEMESRNSFCKLISIRYEVDCWWISSRFGDFSDFLKGCITFFWKIEI